MYEIPTSQSYYEKLLETTNLKWKEIYISPRKVFIDANLCMFQYKVLNNILIFNKLLFKFKKIPSPLCSFCNSADETSLHIFYTCNITKQLCSELQYFVSQYLYIPEINPQSALFGFFNIGNQKQKFLLINHFLLIFKHYLYMLKEHWTVCFTIFKLYLIKMKTVEQNISLYSSQKNETCRRKWRITKIFWSKYIISIFYYFLFLFLSIKDLLFIISNFIYIYIFEVVKNTLPGII